MVVVVLTGGIGSGKSAAAEYLRALGADVIDLDDVAARVLEAGSPVLDAVAARFGDDVVLPDGTLDRAALAKRCFADEDSARRLDEIVHPAVANDVRARCAELAVSPAPPDVLVIEVPLLAEAPDFAALGDLVVAIEAPEETRVERAVARGMDRADVVRRVAVQAPDSARAVLADIVIENRGTQEELASALDALWDILAEAGARNG